LIDDNMNMIHMDLPCSC